ncbi:MAG TPA: phosphate/phosphite/phosphonate ABC transporter substrate-binding protein [Thiotrichales bacterium]|nr:phosphate/phosphite/phosphonate ABC transporter substrate-binding protein [Thiotrichales bacterium]
MIQRILVVSLLLIFSAQAVRADGRGEEDPLLFGFFPIISTVALFKRFAPLRDYLSAELGREVRLETAPDFPTFVRRTADRRYDILVTAPHFALLAADSGLYRIRASLEKDLFGYVVVHEQSPVHTVEELSGKVVATPPAKAIITMSGRRFLLDSVRGIPPHFQPFKSHNAAYEAVLSGQAYGAIVSVNAVNKALAQGKPLRVVSRTPSLPNMATLVATDRDAALGERLQRALVEMGASERGRAVLRQIHFPGYRPASAADYEPVRPFLVEAGLVSERR